MNPEALQLRSAASERMRTVRVSISASMRAMAALTTAALALVTLLATMPAERIFAQDGGAATTVGELVVVPSEVEMGSTALAVGFHVIPHELEVVIEYSEHFTPEGVSCNAAGTAGSTEAAPAPTWITLNACTVGDGWVRLVESATGNLVKEVNVTVIEPGAAGQQAAISVSISELDDDELVPGGSGDRFSVRVTGLEAHREYNLHTVVLNGLSAAFNRACTSFRESESIVGQTSATGSYTVYGCVAPGNRIWSYVEAVGGGSIASTSIRDNEVNVADPTVMFGSEEYDVDEGSQVTVTVELSHPSSHVIRVPIRVPQGADPTVSFRNRSTSETFPYTAGTDTDCEDETVELGFGTLPSNVSRGGSPSNATVTVEDGDVCASFGDTSYEVDAGESVRVEVELSRAPGRTVRIPVRVSPGTDRTVTFTRNATSRTFTYAAPEGCADRTVSLSFGTLPSGVVSGSPDEAEIEVEGGVCASFGDTSYEVDAGESVRVEVELSRAPGRTVRIPVRVSPGRDRTVTFTRNATSRTFTYAAPEGCDDRTVSLSFGTLPSGVVSGSPDEAEIEVEGGVCASFGDTSYEVDEGESVMVEVELSRAPGRTVRIPVRVSPGRDRTVTFTRNATSRSFTYTASQYNSDLTVELDFGTLPSGVENGTPSAATITITEINVPPAFPAGAAPSRSVAENSPAGTDVGSPVGATDADMDDLSYSLSGHDAGSFAIVERTGQIRTSDPLNFEARNSYSVTVDADDGNGSEASIDVTVNVTDVNEAPVGHTIPARTLAPGVLSREIDLSRYFSDPDADDTLVYSAISDPAGFVTTTVRGSMLTIRRVSAGSTEVTVIAADRPAGDPDRMEAEQSFEVTVKALPTITIAPRQGTESVGEGQLVPFTLTADPAPTAELTVNVRVTETGSFIDGTPQAEATFEPGQTTAQFTVDTDDDTIDEEDGTVTATVRPGDGYNVGTPPSASVTVRDDDVTLPTLTIARHPDTDSVIDEGDHPMFRLEMDRAPAADLVVRVSIAESRRGAFLDPRDALTRSVTIPAEQTTADFTVRTVNDDLDEHNADVTVEISRDDTKYALGDPFVAVVRVVDDDDPTAPTGLRANGDLDSSGNVTLRWNSVPGATSYDVRYAEETCIHYSVFVTVIVDGEQETREIERARCEPGTWSRPIPAATTQATLGGLTENTLYRVEVRSTIVSDSPWSHRDFTLVFPTDSPLGDRTVATAPFHGYQVENAQGSHEFRYVTCTGTISADLETPDRNAAVIAQDIEAATEKWESAVVWDTGGNNIVTAESYRPAAGENCTHPLKPVRFFNFLYEIPSGEDRFEVKFVSDERIEAACDPTNQRRSPVPGCWVSLSWLDPGVEPIGKGTILINKALGADKWNARVSGADSCTRLHELVIHEAGHAFGIGKTDVELITDLDFDFNRHPINTEHSVMSYQDSDRDCVPQAYDVAALMALYQSR